jgi:LmbE family N-acetylglucosaminyl deacetylase
MRFLYVFPHPDDESFGPAAVIHSQIEAGHEVYLLTLTRGGATKERHKLGLSVEEMGEVRYREMLAVQRTLGLSGMTVLDYPDNGLKELDPRELEDVVRDHIHEIEPDIIVSYPVHGVSGFHDHIVTHAVVKRVYVELKDADVGFLKRLAFITLPDSGEATWGTDGTARLKLTEEELLDCVIPLRAEDIEAMKSALRCYETYRETIEKTHVIERIGDRLYFEIFGESFSPPLSDLTERLPGT